MSNRKEFLRNAFMAIAISLLPKTLLPQEIKDDHPLIKAIKQLVRDGKDGGWWDKCIAIYPMMGNKIGIVTDYKTDKEVREWLDKCNLSSLEMERLNLDSNGKIIF